jgi:hypothetical protein
VRSTIIGHSGRRSSAALAAARRIAAISSSTVSSVCAMASCMRIGSSPSTKCGFQP